MKNTFAGLLVALALGFGTQAIVACGGGGAPPPMVLNTEATFDAFPTVSDTPATTDSTAVDEVM